MNSTYNDAVRVELGDDLCDLRDHNLGIRNAGARVHGAACGQIARRVYGGVIYLYTTVQESSNRESIISQQPHPESSRKSAAS